MLKQYLKFVIPSICSMVIFNLYTLVDGIFVAHYEGDTALASINVASPYVTTIFSIGVLFAIGSSTVMSIYHNFMYSFMYCNFIFYKLTSHYRIFRCKRRCVFLCRYIHQSIILLLLLLHCILLFRSPFKGRWLPPKIHNGYLPRSWHKLNS